MNQSPQNKQWLNRTVIGVGLASLFSDWAHETATTVLPGFLASLGAAAAWLGAIEGVADGLASFARMGIGTPNGVETPPASDKNQGQTGKCLANPRSR